MAYHRNDVDLISAGGSSSPGMAQVNGLRGETDAPEKMKARVEHDIYYTDHWSLLFDLQVLAMTAFVVLLQKNAQ